MKILNILENASKIQTDANHRYSTETEKAAWNAKLNANANAVSATKLVTARTISLTGDVTGSVSFDGTKNVAITSTVADDSHNHSISTINNLQTTLDGKASNTVVTTTNNGLMPKEDKLKINSMKASSLTIPVNSNSIVWSHNLGNANYVISTIANQPSIVVYFKNKTASSIEIAFYEVTGVSINTYSGYNKTQPVKIDVTLMPLS